MKKNTKLLIKDAFFGTLFSFTIIGILSFFFVNISFFNPLKKAVSDFSFLDVYYAENFHKPNSKNKDIVLVNIENRDRLELAQLLKSIKQGNPKVMGLDMIFKDQKDTFSDSILKNELNSNLIVNSFIIDKDSIIKNNSFFENKNEEGFVNINFNNSTNVIRNFRGIFENKHSFATVISKKFIGKDFEKYNFSEKLRHNKRINYFGNLDDFIHFNFDEILLLQDKSILNDKIVLLGYLGVPTGNIYDVEDKHFTPLNKEISGRSNADMFGVVIHANIINSLINNNLLFKVSNFWIGFFTFLYSFLFMFYFIKLAEKNLTSYFTIVKIVLFLFTIIFMWLTYWLFKKGIVFRSTPIIAITLLSCSFIAYYRYLIKSIKKRFKWKSYIS